MANAIDLGLSNSAMSHDPALDAHEHAEHAEHAAHARDPFVAKVSITVAVLAVMAAAAGSLETVEGGRAITESSEAVLAQDKATDSWNEYQADSLKRHMYDIAVVPAAPKPTISHRYQKEREGQNKAREKAEDAEKDRDKRLRESAMHEERHHWLTGAATLIEIGIALSTVAIITSRRTFWFSAMGLGCVGAALFAFAYTGRSKPPSPADRPAASARWPCRTGTDAP